MYIIEDSFVYHVEKTEHFEVKAGIGKEKKIKLVSETETEKVYECQKFDLTKEKYVLDEDTKTVEIDGKEYKTEKNKIIVKKELSETKARIKHLEEELEKKDLENKIALAEVYDMIIKKGGGASE